MLVLHDPTTLEHKTTELLGSKILQALECPERLMSILTTLKDDPAHEIQTITMEGGTPQAILLHSLLSASHKADYLEHLKTAHGKWLSQGFVKKNETVLPECFPAQHLFSSSQLSSKVRSPPKDIFARAGFYAYDMSAGIAEHTWSAAVASAGLALEGARIVTGKHPDRIDKTTMALCRPPGHHCNGRMAGGYCYINNSVIAVDGIRHYSEVGLRPKFVVLDLDFHHGNGTQEYFYKDGEVLYVSIHGEDEYPYYSGGEDEKGEGMGLNCNVNLPLLAGSTVDDYLDKADLAIKAIESYEPDYIVVSLGFDTFHLDPLGKFKLETPDYETIARHFKSSDALMSLPGLILLEGGYVVEALGPNVQSFLKGWESSND
jgi:acetoin utilization deacetylase AcuC-like enzyme